MSAEPGSDSTRPFAAFEWMLASRYLRARRREGFISVIAGFSFLGIMLGVATLIVVMSVMNGFREELLSKIVGVNGHIFVQPIEQPLTDYAAVAQRIAGVEGVTLAVPLVEGQALASASQSGNNGGALVRGVREQDITRIPFIANTIREGTLAGFDEKGGIAIGRRLAEFLGVRVGDTVTIISPRGSATPMGVAPRIKAYPVVAVFEIGMSEFDGSFVYMPMQEAQAFFNRDGDVSLIEVFLRNADDVDAARDRIDAAAGRPIMMSDWRQRNRTFFSALEVERNVMFLILTLIVLVAALNIISGLIMLVKDKSEDIAILRTMGATRGAVMRVFLITGASIGIVGTIAGFFLGLLITLNVERIRAFMSWLTNTNLFPAELYFLSRLPAVIEPGEVVTVVTMAIVL
ncbi:lipoprotein-releasing ABC transporter permease subunit, partial [Chelatococcus sp.]